MWWVDVASRPAERGTSDCKYSHTFFYIFTPADVFRWLNRYIELSIKISRAQRIAWSIWQQWIHKVLAQLVCESMNKRGLGCVCAACPRSFWLSACWSIWNPPTAMLSCNTVQKHAQLPLFLFCMSRCVRMIRNRSVPHLQPLAILMEGNSSISIPMVRSFVFVLTVVVFVTIVIGWLSCWRLLSPNAKDFFDCGCRLGCRLVFLYCVIICCTDNALGFFCGRMNHPVLIKVLCS